jgi:hypothetical protein
MLASAICAAGGRYVTGAKSIMRCRSFFVLAGGGAESILLGSVTVQTARAGGR